MLWKYFVKKNFWPLYWLLIFFLIWKVRNNLFSESIDFKDFRSGRRIFISLYNQNGENVSFFCSLSSVSFLKVINTVHRSIAEVDFWYQPGVLDIVTLLWEKILVFYEYFCKLKCWREGGGREWYLRYHLKIVWMCGIASHRIPRWTEYF